MLYYIVAFAHMTKINSTVITFMQLNFRMHHFLLYQVDSFETQVRIVQHINITQLKKGLTTINLPKIRLRSKFEI